MMQVMRDASQTPQPHPLHALPVELCSRALLQRTKVGNLTQPFGQLVAAGCTLLTHNQQQQRDETRPALLKTLVCAQTAPTKGRKQWKNQHKSSQTWLDLAPPKYNPKIPFDLAWWMAFEHPRPKQKNTSKTRAANKNKKPRRAQTRKGMLKHNTPSRLIRGLPIPRCVIDRQDAWRQGQGLLWQGPQGVGAVLFAGLCLFVVFVCFVCLTSSFHVLHFFWAVSCWFLMCVVCLFSCRLLVLHSPRVSFWSAFLALLFA